MLQYSSLVRPAVGSSHSSIPALKPLPHGEICITFEQADDDSQGRDDVMQVLVLCTKPPDSGFHPQIDANNCR